VQGVSIESVSGLVLNTKLFRPGLRLAIGLSSGADSVALTRALAERAGELGLVLHAAHLHHGLRGADADEDQRFAADLAESLRIPFHTARVDTEREASSRKESIEEAARRLRYGWFRELMAVGRFDAVATAHTLDDQAETVLGKFLRGAWTEGLSGIHPVVDYPEGQILRPLLGMTRPAIEAYLNGLEQAWREDASNRDPAYTRNRIRHGLLPDLESWNPRIREHLAGMAELARDEETWWDAEMERLAPQMILTGRAVRGGGRASSGSEGIALDVVRVGTLSLAVQRRLLRYATATLGVSLGFEATETLRQLAIQGRAGQKLSLPGSLVAERTARELRIAPGVAGAAAKTKPEEIALPVPGEAEGFGWRFRAVSSAEQPAATVRNWRAGDRVTLRYSSGPRKIKEVLERLKVTGSDREQWPVVEWQGQVVWMQGAELQPVPAIAISAWKLDLHAPSI
jgi:tRNA(Ile)-lysidine synthase